MHLNAQILYIRGATTKCNIGFFLICVFSRIKYRFIASLKHFPRNFQTAPSRETLLHKNDPFTKALRAKPRAKRKARFQNIITGKFKRRRSLEGSKPLYIFFPTSSKSLFYLLTFESLLFAVR